MIIPLVMLNKLRLQEQFKEAEKNSEFQICKIGGTTHNYDIVKERKKKDGTF